MDSVPAPCRLCDKNFARRKTSLSGIVLQNAQERTLSFCAFCALFVATSGCRGGLIAIRIVQVCEDFLVPGNDRFSIVLVLRSRSLSLDPARTITITITRTRTRTNRIWVLWLRLSRRERERLTGREQARGPTTEKTRASPTARRPLRRSPHWRTRLARRRFPPRHRGASPAGRRRPGPPPARWWWECRRFRRCQP